MRFLRRLRPRHGAAIAAGLLWAFSFPLPGVAGLAWLAPGILFLTGLGRPGGECFRLGYLSGLAHYLASLHWLLHVPFPAGAVAGWIALSLFLALYPAVWLWLSWKLVPFREPAPGGWAAAGQFLATTTWWQRAGCALLSAALWVALEMVRARLLSGFPWNPLGVSQYRMLPLIQVASVAGVYGVSFLVAWFSLSLAIALLRLARQPGAGWRCLAELRLALVGLVGVTAFGIGPLIRPAEAARELKVALVQPSVPQTLIWDRDQDEPRFNKVIELSRLALASRPDLLVWPESAMPAFTEENFQVITNLIAGHKVWMIFGADDAERRPGAANANDYDAFNAAFLFGPDGRHVATYHKQHLVMFGEYLPLARVFPVLRNIIPIPGDFTPGQGQVTFALSDPPVRTAVLICFEDVFPSLARSAAADDVDFLLNLTNDGWFGNGDAQWQQAANAVFRAVENGLPLVRCTNNGLTCWIDARGVLREILGEGRDVYAPGFMTARIPLAAGGRNGERTFYRRRGDVFGWACVLVSAAAIGLAMRRPH